MTDGDRLMAESISTETSERASLGQTSQAVITDISPLERMPCEDTDGYLAVGRSALRAVRLAQLAAGLADFSAILDMPSGHGRVLRWLQAAYPQAKLTACDLIADGVDHCANTFGATPVYSVPQPTLALFPDRYDLIWVGSLLTHVDVDQWDRLLTLWHELLVPDGLLIFTTHGELVAQRMRQGHLYDYPAPAIARALRAYDHSGFAFLEEHPEQVDYGITVSRPQWVLDRVLRQREFRVVLYTETLWANHQDVVAVVKRRIDVTMAERPD